jgi:hypothetical protein
MIVYSFLFPILFYSNVFSTAQIPDKILFNGDTCSLNSTPLESFFQNHPNLRPTEGISTACWRGYVGWYKIIDNTLVVFDMCCNTGKNKTMSIRARKWYKTDSAFDSTKFSDGDIKFLHNLDGVEKRFNPNQ